LASLVKRMDETINAASGKHPQKLGTFVIIGDAPGRVEELRGLAECESLKRVTLCVGDAPARYEVNKNAEVTVVIYTPGRPGRQTVTANFTMRPGELDAARSDAIIAALSNVLPK
jgi:hypothetical protein